MNAKDSMPIIILLVIFAAALLIFTPEPKFSKEIQLGKPTHIHALVNITICGQHKDLPDHGEKEHYLGLPLLHTHDDNVMHIEGVVIKKEDISLGAFFDAIKVKFDKDKIMNVKNGDKCAGKPAKLKMFVNGNQTEEFKGYIPFATQNPQEQVINLIFDS